ncbi:hypothetical protein V8F06_009191 [Rhypophila decipiens]
MAFTMFNVLSLVFVLFSTFAHSYPIAAGLLLSERDEVVPEPHPSQSVVIAIAVPVAIGGVVFFLAIAYYIRKKLRAKQDRGKRVSGNSSGMTFEMDNLVPPPPPPHRSSPSRPPPRVPPPVAQPGPSGQRAGRKVLPRAPGLRGRAPLHLPSPSEHQLLFPGLVEKVAPALQGELLELRKVNSPDLVKDPQQGPFREPPRGLPRELRKGRHEPLGPPLLPLSPLIGYSTLHLPHGQTTLPSKRRSSR